jgi:enediyne polyketide synthase
LEERLKSGRNSLIDPTEGLFLGHGSRVPRIGFLFPGQASPVRRDAGIFADRWEIVWRRFASADWPVNSTDLDTAFAQSAIVTASLAGMDLLDRFRFAGSVAIGHSLGELTALHWAGVFDALTLARVTAARGFCMGAGGGGAGGMFALNIPAEKIDGVLQGLSLVVAAHNSSTQTVIAGPAQEIGTAEARARAKGMRATRLPVRHAFHSVEMIPARDAFRLRLAGSSARLDGDRRLAGTGSGRGRITVRPTDGAGPLHRGRRHGEP